MGDTTSLLERLAESLDEARRPLAFVAAGAVVAGIAVRSLGGKGFSLWIGNSFLILAVVSGVVLFAVVVPPAFRRRVGAQTDQPRVTVGGRVILGVHAGRTAIEYGAALIDGNPGQPLGGLHINEIIPTRTRAHPGSGREAVYKSIAGALVDLLRDIGDHTVDAAAIALPGLVNVRERTLESSAGGLPPNSQVANEVARRILHDDPAVARIFGLASGDVAALAARIYLDNDARSIGRYVVNQRRQDWHNYACILVSEGVGSCLILGSRIYYGSFTGAGETGHQTLQLSDDHVLHLGETMGDSAAQLVVPDCRCRKAGLHFEMIANDVGVVSMAQALNPKKFADLAEALGVASENVMRYDVLLAAAERSLGTEAPAHLQLPRAAADLVDSDAYRTYFAAFINQYARLLAIGAANLVNVLDLDNVVFTGPVVSAFDRLDMFSQRLQAYRAQYVIREDRVGMPIEPDLADHIWEGAALVIRDLDYADFIRS
jgi:predicted NBD/HSP70 family sugar kinase